MSENSLTPEIDPILKKMKLKKPSQELMADYLKGVNVKIDSMTPNRFHLGFPGILLSVFVVMALAGFFYFQFVRQAPKVVSEPPVLRQIVETQPLTVLPKTADEQKPEAFALPPPAASQELAQPQNLAAQSNSLEGEKTKLAQFTAEQEATLLEALDAGIENEPVESLEDEELVKELNLLDDLEFSAPANVQPAGGI